MYPERGDYVTQAKEDLDCPQETVWYFYHQCYRYLGRSWAHTTYDRSVGDEGLFVKAKRLNDQHSPCRYCGGLIMVGSDRSSVFIPIKQSIWDLCSVDLLRRMNIEREKQGLTPHSLTEPPMQ